MKCQKDAKLKSIFIMILMCMILAFVAYAMTITQTYPSNEWVTSNSVNINFTAVSRVSPIPYCVVYMNDSSSFVLRANYTDVPNGTPFVRGIPVSDTDNITSGWNVTCLNSTTGTGQEVSATTHFGVDGNTPSITLDSPASGSHLNNMNTTMLKYTPTDTSNPEECVFYINLSGTWAVNQTNTSWESGTQIVVNLSKNVNNHTPVNLPDGLYAWNAKCNDTAGNTDWGGDGGNWTFTVDTLLPETIKFLTPSLTQVFSSNSTPEIIWNQTTESNFENYVVRVSRNHTFTDVIQSITITTKTSNSTFLGNLETDMSYYIRVTANDEAGNYINTTTDINYTLDRTSPVVTLNAPTNNTFTNDDTPIFNVTITDANPDACTLYLSIISGSVAPLNTTSFGVTSASPQNITVTSMADGVYRYNLGCNDSIGTEVNVSSTSLQLTIDTTSPTEPNLTSSWFQTNNTDTTPMLKWLTAVESNFSRYLAMAYYLNNYSLAYEVNITTKTVNQTPMSLVADNTYIFNVTTYDLAGNTAVSNSTVIGTRYYVDPVCGILTTGWNLCGATWTSAKNLSLIGAETSATFVSVWNQTHQWATCNYAASPGGQHCNVNVNISSVAINTSLERTLDLSINHAVWVYVNTSTEWRNRTWVATGASASITLINTTNGWNLEAGFFRNGRTFGHLSSDAQFGDDNVSMMSLRYNNGTSVPYVNSGLFAALNNNTNVDYGRGYWIFYNATVSNGSNGNHTWDVSGW